MPKHLFSYPYNGKDHALTVDADSAEEAYEKLNAAIYANYEGIKTGEQPAYIESGIHLIN